jgi:fumarylacetoacetase
MSEAISRTWVPGADGSGFGIENLPYGVVRRGDGPPLPAVRIGEYALVLAEVAKAGLLDVAGLTTGAFAGPTLNPFIELGPSVWSATRGRLVELLTSGNDELQRAGVADRALVGLAEVQTGLPVKVGDYVDFYASIEHASNLGRMFRPDSDPLTANWRHVPIGYHGRAGTVVTSGTPIRRPSGQRAPAEPGGLPSFGPERRLDIELELGFITGPGPELGMPIAASAADAHIFGFVLVNDWSAREIQRWEYVPLGPFLGKSFATSVAPWIVPLEAVDRLRVPGRAQEPVPLPYLRVDKNWALDIDLEVALVPDGSERATTISRTNARGLYWNAAQQLGHATVNGARVRAGDLFASGTISGPDPGTEGSLMELSWGGREAIALDDGTERTFLEDGDEIVISGEGERDGVRISFGEVRGRIEPAAASLLGAAFGGSASSGDQA